MTGGAERLIVALDTPPLATAMGMARQLAGVVRVLKVGSILFTACGPEVITRLRTLGFQVMLDLKFFDIPSTVEQSCRAAVHHRVSLVTVHALGAREMLEAAVRGIQAEARRVRVEPPRLLAITVLTSVGTQAAPGLTRRVAALAATALQAGCDGVVASAQEAAMLRKRFGEAVEIVCPGIRPTGVDLSDQRRVCTPVLALEQGASRLVVGRPITAAHSPREAARAILAEMDTVMRRDRDDA